MTSLILITVDCLRADHVGFLGYDRPTTPFLDTLAEESIVFSNAMVAGSPTYYSFPAIMASRHPLSLGRDLIGLAPGEPTLATALKDSGYETAAFTAGNPYLSPRFGYDAGFDTFCDFLDSASRGTTEVSSSGSTNLRKSLNRRLAGACHKVGLGSVYDELYFQYCQRTSSPRPQSYDELRCYPAADVIVDHAEEWLAGIGNAPFFLWLHFMDPHAPYYPPEQALTLMGTPGVSATRASYLNHFWNRGDLLPQRLQRHLDEIISLYDAGIRWMDTQVARLVETLRQFHLWESCVVAFTADHGEEFLDHGGRFHPPLKLNAELMRVPLLLRPADHKRQGISSLFSLVHLAPTLLHALGLVAPPDFQGRSHWPEIRSGNIAEEPVVAECVADCTNPFRFADRVGPRILAVRDGRFKLVLDFAASREYLFDLDIDFAEQHPLPAGVVPKVRGRLLDRARRHIADSIQLRGRLPQLNARVRDLRLEWANSSSQAAPN